MRHLARFLCLCLLFAIPGQGTRALHAQANVAPFVAIANVDVTAFPEVEVALYGDVRDGKLGEVPIQVSEGGQVQTILSDSQTDSGLHMAIVLDPADLSAAGYSGQSHMAEVNAILLDLIEQEVVVRGEDWLAAYTMNATLDTQAIQEWTAEPNLIFNSTVQHNVDTQGQEPDLTALLSGVLDQFQAPAPVPMARNVLLFTAGSSPLDVETVVDRALREQVHFNVVELASPSVPAANEDALQELARQTHGAFLLLQDPEDLQLLWRRLAALRTQRLLVYRSNTTGPASIEVALAQDDGAPLVASAPLPVESGAVQPLASAGDPVAEEPAEAAVPVAAAEALAPLLERVAQPDELVQGAPVQGVPAQGDALDEAGSPGDTVLLPGISVAIPRVALQLALPILLVLLAFFGYREMRDRGARRKKLRSADDEPQSAEGLHYDFEEDEPLEPLARPRPAQPGGASFVKDEGRPPELPPPPSSYLTAEDEDQDDVTVVPMRFDDNEATYRLRDDVRQPVLGYLLRVTNDPNLPQQLTVYGLRAGPGEVRRIHIGRHSKNNTVVINDKSISREHAVIVQKEGRLYLRDNASTAGTFLNWRRLKPGEELLLRNNDLISLGEIVYEFRTKGEDEVTVVLDR